MSSSSSSSDMTKTMVLTQLCPEIEQGIRNMNSDIPREQINNDISNIRLESMKSAYPDVQYAILLFRKYANDANDKIDNLSAKPYEVDQFVGKVGTILSPYINDEAPPIPDIIVPLQGLSAFTRNIFKFRSATTFLSFVALVILCCTHEVFDFSLTEKNFESCYFSSYADSTLYISLVYYFFLFLDALFLFIASLCICVYYTLPIDPSTGLKYIPELFGSSKSEDEFLNDTTESSSDIQTSSSSALTRRAKKSALCELCAGVISKCCGRVAESIQRYCQENPMQVLLIIDIMLLSLNVACIIQGRYGLYDNFKLRFLLFSPYRAPTPVMSMYFSLDTFYHTFTSNSDAGMDCLPSSPIGKLEASLWFLTFALILQCFQVRLSIKCYHDELKLLDSMDTARSQQGERGDVESNTRLMASNDDNSSSHSPSASPARMMRDRSINNAALDNSQSTALPSVNASTLPPVGSKVHTSSASPSKFKIEEEDDDEDETITLGGNSSPPSTDL